MTTETESLLVLIEQWEDKANQAEKYAHYEQAKQLRDCADQLRGTIIA